MPRFFWWICRCIPKTLLRHHSTQIMIIYPPKSEHLSPKIDHHQQLVNIYPKSNHSLPKMVIYALFTSKCRESHLRAFVVKSTRVPGLGQGGGGSSQSWQCQDFHGACYSIPSLTAPRRRGQPDPALGLWCNDCYGYLFDIPSPPRQQLADPPLPLHARKNTI